MSNLYVDNIKPSSSWNSNELASNNIPDYVSTYTGLSASKTGVKVWLNYDHVNDSVKSSFNVSSVDDNAAGNFTINFATSLSDTEYAVSGMTNGTSSDGNNTYGIYLNNNSLMTTSSIKLITQAAGGTDADNLVNCITIHGN
mgnify:CR=1 FL=1